MCRLMVTVCVRKLLHVVLFDFDGSWRKSSFSMAFRRLLNIFILRKKTNTNVLRFLSSNVFPSLTVTPATQPHWFNLYRGASSNAREPGTMQSKTLASNETQPPKLKLRLHLTYRKKEEKNQGRCAYFFSSGDVSTITFLKSIINVQIYEIKNDVR